jgi:flagellar biosynthesis/type III secretory pathway protein FliH
MGLPRRSENDSIGQQEERVGGLLKETYKLGYMQGFHQGYSHGAKDATEHFKPAISDGLRKGSSLCGKEMRKFRK